MIFWDYIGGAASLPISLPKWVGGKLRFLKFLSSPNNFSKYLVGHLAPSSHCSILIVTPRLAKAGWENDLSIPQI